MVFFGLIAMVFLTVFDRTPGLPFKVCALLSSLAIALGPQLG